MVKVWVLAGVVCLCAAVAVGEGSAASGGPAETGAPAAAPVKKVCTVINAPPTPAETALSRKEYANAEKLFRAALVDPTDEAAHEGLIRTLLEENRLTEAQDDADAWVKAAPASSMALVALADVQVRRGDPTTGYATYTKALIADLCNARGYYGHGHVEALAGWYLSERNSIAQAYALHPSDDDIHTAWISTRPRSERLALWADYARHSEQISDEDRAHLETRLEKESLYHPSDCRISPASPQEAKVPMVAVRDGPDHFLGWGLDVKFNAKSRRLQIDTGASGITISRAAAMFLGIHREDSTDMGGIGDDHRVKTSIAHVASIRIGDVELQNCAVEILEKWSVLEDDGLIGADVFRNSVVTLDFPKQQLRLSPLPSRPAEAQSKGTDEDAEPQPHNPYVAPEMKDWTRIFRSGHELLMPTRIVPTKRIKDPTAWKNKIFMLDTGSYSNLISPAAAREVTKVSRDSSMEVRGIQGAVNQVFSTSDLTFQFTNLRMDAPQMTAIDMTDISHDTGVEISGLIGAPALFQVVMHIDYRDNLVWCEYNKKN